LQSRPITSEDCVKGWRDEDATVAAATGAEYISVRINYLGTDRQSERETDKDRTRVSRR